MNQNIQIVEAFENLSLTPAQIAEQFPPLTEIAVKACLMQFSGKYRTAMNEDIQLNFSDKELVEANDTMLRLMRHSEDEHLQFKVARYIRDDKKGRLDIGKNLAGVHINAYTFNQYLIEGKEALKLSKESSDQKTLPQPAANETIDV